MLPGWESRPSFRRVTFYPLEVGWVKPGVVAVVVVPHDPSPTIVPSDSSVPTPLVQQFGPPCGVVFWYDGGASGMVAAAPEALQSFLGSRGPSQVAASDHPHRKREERTRSSDRGPPVKKGGSTGGATVTCAPPRRVAYWGLLLPGLPLRATKPQRRFRMLGG